MMMFQYSRRGRRWFLATGGGSVSASASSFVVLLTIIIILVFCLQLLLVSSSSSVFVAVAAVESSSSSSSSSRSSSSTSTSTKDNNNNNNNNYCPTEILQYTVSGCQELHQIQSQKQPPTTQYWKEIRDIYIDVVGINKSTISWPQINSSNISKEEDEQDQDQQSQKQIQQQPFSGIATDLIEVKYIPTTGRGLYAKTFIPNGTIIWNADWYHAIFTNECSFKLFLSKITWTQACDALQWCYVYEYDDDYEDDDSEDDDDGIGIGCALDEGSLFNHAPSGLDNAGYKDLDAMDVTTLRDIKVGEELVQDYDAFETFELDWFTNLYHTAWGDDCFETDNVDVDVDVDVDDIDDNDIEDDKEEL